MSNAANEIQRVTPIRITDNDSGNVYELDFDRETAVFAQNRGFKPDDVVDYPTAKVPELFFYAFRKNHKRVPKNQTDALLQKMGGLTVAMISRLLALYDQASQSFTIADEEDMEKNAKVTVEL